ncbi:cell division protein FtsW, partial [Corynebacterium flavescens]
MKRILSRGTELGLLILATLVFAITLVSLELSQGNVLTLEVLYLIGGFIGVFAVAHFVLCFLAPYSDQFMLPIVAV